MCISIVCLSLVSLFCVFMFVCVNMHTCIFLLQKAFLVWNMLASLARRVIQFFELLLSCPPSMMLLLSLYLIMLICCVTNYQKQVCTVWVALLQAGWTPISSTAGCIIWEQSKETTQGRYPCFAEVAWCTWKTEPPCVISQVYACVTLPFVFKENVMLCEFLVPKWCCWRSIWRQKENCSLGESFSSFTDCGIVLNYFSW